ncbi:MAG: cellulose synthase complex periplasmic endoglucanase BcsZ [Burkholderiales bacterium]
MRRRILILVWGLLAAVLPSLAAGDECKVWPAWESFRGHFINDSGRVIDPSSGQTTSEGQSYALFFALAANDRTAFDRILRWTEDNLASGDLTSRLPAWQWGKHDDGTWGVIDDNAAADADLWIAYTLAEAGTLWKVPKYASLGELLAGRILREETAKLPGLGQILLPGPRGFHPETDLWRLNPSYVPLQLVHRMAALYPKSDWRHLVPTSVDLIVRSAPLGFAPEWIAYKTDGGFQVDHASQGVGSFNAIRVYLWAGMLADDDPVRPVLLKTFAPMSQYVAAQGIPPLQTKTREGTAIGSGPASFSAALLPFLAAAKLSDTLHQQRLRVEVKAPLDRTDNYYDQVLTLFGLGWIEGRYRFARDGALIPNWTCAANSSQSR